MVSVYVEAGVHDISNKFTKLETWRKETEGIGRFVFTIENKDNEFGGVFAAQNGVHVTVNNAIILKGYLDIAKPTSRDNISCYYQKMDLTGRDVGQDLANKICSKKYYNQHADDIIEDMLTAAGSEITFTSPHTAPNINFEEGIDKHLLECFRTILERINYSGFVNFSKVWNMFAHGSQDSGITLKSVKDAQDNNILDLEKVEFDAVELWNYILVRGGKVLDGWSEGNALDLTGDTGNVLENTYAAADVKEGVAAIKSLVGEATYCSVRYVFPLYNYTVLDLGLFGSHELGFWLKQYVTGQGGNNGMAPFVRLIDNSGNAIDYRFHGSTPLNEMVKYAVPIGHTATQHPNSIGVGGEYEKWVQAAGTGFNWSAVKEIQFHSELATVTYIVLDGVSLPVEMVAISQDSGSQGQYEARYKPFKRPDIPTQIELQAFADSQKAKLKDPVEGLRVWVKGVDGIVDSTYKFLPGYKVTVNVPNDGYSNVAMRIFEGHEVIMLNASHGFDFVAELVLVPATATINTRYYSETQDPQAAILREFHERLLAVENRREREVSFLLGLPGAVPERKVWIPEGTAFPANPVNGQRFRRTDLDIDFRYSSTEGMWIPCDWSWVRRSDIRDTINVINLAPNHSFETDTDSDNKPDFWTFAGTAVVSRTDIVSHHGKYCLKVDGYEGQSFEGLSDFIAINVGVYLNFSVWAAEGVGEGLAFKARLYWYKGNKTASSTPYTELNFKVHTTWTSSWKAYPADSVMPPSDARYCKIKLYISGMITSNVWLYDEVELMESLAAKAILDEIGTNFPTDNLFEGRRFIHKTMDQKFRYSEIAGWLPCDFAIVSRMVGSLATRSKPTYSFDGSIYSTNSTSYVEITDLREDLPAMSEFRHHLYKLSCAMRHTGGGGNYCYVQVRYLINDANETVICTWSELISGYFVPKTYDCDIKTGKNEKLTIKWYIQNKPSGVPTAEMKDAKTENRGIEYREDIPE